MELLDFYRKHDGQTCIVCGVGPNLESTPPESLSFPSFGVNTIYKRAGWMPTYFVGVDERLRLDDGPAICEKYRDIPKFFPTPDWDALQGENIYRFKHRTGGELTIGGQSPLDIKSLTVWGITYYRIMDAVFQIAAWMGFTTLLCVGFSHDTMPKYRRLFWGIDEREMSSGFEWEEYGYKYFSTSLPVKILNISRDTFVPESVLPRDDYGKWINQ